VPLHFRQRRASMDLPKVDALCIYPVKGCGSLSLDRAMLDATGLHHDRAWMLVDTNGNAITLRENTTLTQIRPRLAGGAIAMHAHAFTPLLLRDHHDGARISAALFEHTIETVRDTEGSQWFSEVLKQPVSLVRRSPAHPRPSSKSFPGHFVDFADVYPVTVLSRASVDTFAAQANLTGDPNLLERFRANIVLRNTQPFAEDEGHRLTFESGAALSFAKRTARCLVVNIAHDTGKTSMRTLKALASLRADANNVYFASSYLVDKLGIICKGDTVTF
jgi:uncharacterized protein